MKTDRRISLALVAIIGLSIGWLLPTETRSLTNASIPTRSAIDGQSDHYTALNSSLDELQVLVAKLQPPKTSQPQFKTVLESCCKECICPDCPRCDEPTTSQPSLVASSTTKPSTKNQVLRTSEAYTPRWTHPSTIEDHMVSTHGVSTVGKTRAQLYAEHDALHDAQRSRSLSVTSSRSNYSSCPGGVCPVPSRTAAPVRMFRFFRR